MIPYPGPLLAATFIRRDNRFRAAVLVDGQPVAARIANSGRLSELFVPGQPCYVTSSPVSGRKTGFDLRLVAYAGTLVSVDAQLPNALFEEALTHGTVALSGYESGTCCWRREVRVGRSRIDFLLERPGGARCWVETKSVTLVEDGRALFPDAPSDRGRRHLEELAAAVAMGDQAALAFIVQRADARALAPHPMADPAFAAALRHADAVGVALCAFTCRVCPEGIELLEAIPVIDAGC
jgi:sugar fermentation stimulation protein A